MFSQNSGSESSETIIVTGAAGFLGSHICERYLERGCRVIGLDNFSTGQRINVELLQSKYPSSKSGSGKYQFIEFDVVENWNSAFSKVDSQWLSGLSKIFHFASPASPPAYQRLSLETMRVNARGTENAVEFADHYKARVIFASTSEIYGDPDRSPQNERYWGNVNSYGERSCYDEAKRYGESWIYTSNLRNSTRHGMVRIFNTYGPRMNVSDGRVIINLLVQGMTGHPLTVYGDGSQTRSFCYVDDLISGIIAYADKGLMHPMNLGNGVEFTVLELAQKIQKMFDSKSLEIHFLKLPSDDPKQRKPDLTRALSELGGWMPRVNLQEGLVKMRQWLEANPQLLSAIQSEKKRA